MIIIFAADDIDTDLEELAEKYDRAKSPSERDQVAEDTYALIGGRIKSMIKRIGRGLADDDLDGFAGQALFRPKPCNSTFGAWVADEKRQP